MIGQLFKQLALTITYAMIASIFSAMFLVPRLALTANVHNISVTAGRKAIQEYFVPVLKSALNLKGLQTDYLTSLGFNDPTTFMSDVKSAIDDLKNVNENAIYNKSLRNIEDLVEEPLSGDAFWDVDNPYNRFTIAQMRNCNISVIKSSRQ